MKIKRIVIHCSDSEFGCASTIRQWHIQRGWKDIGYHFTILNGKPSPSLYMDELDGSIEVGRVIGGDKFLTGDEVGAHTFGFNKDSLAVCLIGKKDFTWSQEYSLLYLVRALITKYEIKKEDVFGHYELDPKKTCPNMDMEVFRGAL